MFYQHNAYPMIRETWVSSDWDVPRDLFLGIFWLLLLNSVYGGICSQPSFVFLSVLLSDLRSPSLLLRWLALTRVTYSATLSYRATLLCHSRPPCSKRSKWLSVLPPSGDCRKIWGSTQVEPEWKSQHNLEELCHGEVHPRCSIRVWKVPRWK